MYMNRDNEHKEKSIIPAFLEQNFNSVLEKVNPFVGDAPIVQIDICDGVYTPTPASWPYTENADWNRIEEIKSKGIMVEFDLMIQRPEEYIVAILSANPRRVIIHYNSTQYIDRILAILNGYYQEYPKFEFGVAFTLDTELSSIQ